MTNEELIQAMRDDIQSWTPEDLRVGLMLQYRRIGDLVAEVERLTPLQYREAPCRNQCEAQAFKITERNLEAELKGWKQEHYVLHVENAALKEANVHCSDDFKQMEEHLAKTFNQGVEACMLRLHEMNRITTGRHNFYVHAAAEMAKLKELE